MNRDRLINDVRHCLDEQELLSEVEMSIEDSMPISERIEALFCGAFNTLQGILPLKTLMPCPLPEDTHEADIQTGTGTVDLPADYLRLHTFRMQGWKRSVHTAIHEDSADYAYQLVDATRGGRTNPVVAVINDKSQLRYFSLPKGDSPHIIEKASYIRTADNIEDADIRQEAYPLLVWWLARDVAVSFQRDTTSINEMIKTMLSSYGN